MTRVVLVAVVSFTAALTGQSPQPPHRLSPSEEIAKYRTEELEANAAKGEASAAVELADMYSEGERVPQDLAKAYTWYSRAADMGDQYGLNKQAWMLSMGKGIASDPAKAVALFRKGAVQKDPYAAYELGWHYENGKGVPQDDASAVRWYTLAADGGDVDAAASLGWLTETGRGTAKDDTKAAKLYFLAAQKGNAQAQGNLGWFFASGRGVPEKNYPMALSLLQSAAANGNSRAYGNLGYLHEHGLGVPKDLAKAFEFFKKSAELGDDISLEHLGWMYHTGSGTMPDSFASQACFRKAIELGRNSARQGLDETMIEDLDPRNTESRLRELRQRSAEGSEVAMFVLGLQHLTGSKLVHPNQKKALELLEASASKGFGPAMRQLGTIYQQGPGPTRDLARSESWFTKAEALGYQRPLPANAPRP